MDNLTWRPAKVTRAKHIHTSGGHVAVYRGLEVEIAQAYGSSGKGLMFMRCDRRPGEIFDVSYYVDLFAAEAVQLTA